MIPTSQHWKQLAAMQTTDVCVSRRKHAKQVCAGERDEFIAVPHRCEEQRAPGTGYRITVLELSLESIDAQSVQTGIDSLMRTTAHCQACGAF